MSKANGAEFWVPEIALQSKDHEEILDVIDYLRSQGISKYIALPQLIVCGDQSSGKSSVLEAISGLSFPARDNLCTRFATELILRRDIENAVVVTIQPGEDRSEDEKEALRKFKSPTAALDDFAAIVKSAEKEMGLDKATRALSKDVLRVEVTGTKLPHLTLVDLPGLYHAPDGSQDDEGIDLVESMVLSYMENERSIMLAVISAQSDLVLQKVTKFTRRVDPKGLRTLGIITKPDTLFKGSDLEMSFVKLANNERVYFRLGWHVLKNRNYEERKCSLKDRHRLEEKFLSERVWATLPRKQVGIDALRLRLSAVLKDQILSHLPRLLQEAERGVDDAQARLLKLGASRSDLMQQKRYLLHISEGFTTLIGNSINGFYDDRFFGDAMNDDDYSKRLRAVMQNTLLHFADTMHKQGRQREIIDDDDLVSGQEGRMVNQILRTDFIHEVRVRMERSRGRELPGTFNPLIIGELFYLQSKPWKIHVGDCTEELLEKARRTLTLTLTEVADEKTVEELLRNIIDPAVDRIEVSLRMKILELLKPQQDGHPITCNRYFTENVQRAREKHFRRTIVERMEGFFGRAYPNPENLNTQKSFVFNMSSLVDALGRQSESDMDRFSCSEAIDCMEAYYKVALKKFIDDFAVLAVERCLMDQLLGIFSPKVVEALEDDAVGRIAAESAESLMERLRLNEMLQGLQNSVQKLRRLDRYKPSLQIPVGEPDLGPDMDSSKWKPEESPIRALSSASQDLSPVEVAIDELADVFAQEIPEPPAESSEKPPDFGIPAAPQDLFAQWGVERKIKKPRMLRADKWSDSPNSIPQDCEPE